MTSRFKGLTLADVDRDDRIGDLFVEALLYRVTGNYVRRVEPSMIEGHTYGGENIKAPGEDLSNLIDSDGPSGGIKGWPEPPPYVRMSRLSKAQKGKEW